MKKKDGIQGLGAVFPSEKEGLKDLRTTKKMKEKELHKKKKGKNNIKLKEKNSP